HLAWLKDIAELHQFAAVLALESGKGGVASNIITMLALARTLDHEPCVISQLVRLRILNMAFDVLERRASRAAFDAPEIAELSRAFAQTQTTNLMVNAMIGERAMTLPYFRMARAEYEKL